MVIQLQAKKMLFWGVLWSCLHLTSGLLFAENPPVDPTKETQLQKRIDFGNSYIMGQSIKSGAVYLMHRKKSDIKSMLKSREHYRNEILEDLKVKGVEPETSTDVDRSVN